MTTGRRPARGRPVTTTGLLVLGVAGGLLSGCSDAVEVTAVPDHVAGGCDRAVVSWPTTVARQERRPVRPQNPAAAAWGDPAIIATCGWPEVAPTTDECIAVDGVDWVAHPLADGVRFTTFGRSPAIEVLVPEAYQPEPLVLPAFGPAAKALPVTGRSCS